MKPVKLTLAKTSINLGEIFQALEIKFSFVRKNKGESYTQLFSGVKCRDFLGDCIWSRETGKPVNIYGFRYNYKTKPFDEEELRLSLTFPNEESKLNFINNFHMIWDKEQQADITLLFNAVWIQTNSPLTLIILANSIWQSTIWKLSLFTFYLKCCSYKNPENLDYPEKLYKEWLHEEKEHELLGKIFEPTEIIKNDLSLSHNFSGFVSILKKQNEQMYNLLLGK